MRNVFFVFLAILAGTNACNSLRAQENNNILFEENIHQHPEQVQFKASVGPADIYFENQTLTYVLANPEDLDAVHTLKHSAPHQEEGVTVNYHSFKMEFVNSKKPDAIRGTSQKSYYRNYYRGNDKSKWSSRVRVYEGIQYKNIYDGIDAIFYSHSDQLKYDLLVKAGTNTQQIKMRYEGLNALSKSGENLYLHNSAVSLQEQAPYAYQTVDGAEIQVPCFFKIEGEVVSFEFPNSYDQSVDLIIDPTLIFATMTGSSSDNWGTSATNDPDGNLVGCGVTFGTAYPTTLGAFQETFGGADSSLGTDISVIKYNDIGTDAIFSTYIGGGSSEFPHSSVVNADGEIIIMGTTSSGNFPTLTNSFDRSFGGGNGTDLNNIGYPSGSDIIVVKLSGDGSALLGSTFLGGSRNDGLNVSNNLSFNYSDDARGEVNVDAANNIYIASSTQSLDFPLTAGAFQQNYGGGLQDGVLVKLNEDLSDVIWSTYFGGIADDAVYSSKVDQNGDLYATGGTNSTDLPTLGNTVNATFQGGAADGFITHLSGTDSDLIASTFLGTDDFDQSYLLDLDDEGNVYVVGQSVGGYPVEGDVYSDPGTTQFLHKLNPELTETFFSTVFGEGDEINISPTAFLVDDCSRIYVSGWGGNTQASGNGSSSLIGTTHNLLVTNDAIQKTTDGSDFYIILFEPNATGVNYASFFGSNTASEHVDGGTSRFDKTGVIYQAVCAGCGGNSFPTTPGVWSEENGSSNCNLGAFKFAFEQDLVIADFSTQSAQCPSSVMFENNSFGGVDYLWDFGDGETSSDENPSHTYQVDGSYSVSLTVSNPATCNEDDATVQVLAIAGSSSPGMIDGGGTACSDGTLNAEITQTGMLQANHSLSFVLSESETVTPSNILDQNDAGEFSFSPSLDYNTTYYIIAVVLDQNDNVILDDDCVGMSNPVPVLWLSPLEMIVQPFCDNGTGEFSVTVFVSGGFPEFNGDDSTYTISGDGNFTLLPGEGATISFGAFDGQQYSFSAVDEFGCSGSILSDVVSCTKNAVELSNFNGRALEVGNELHWTTASETDHSHFEVQRLKEGQWVNIGKVNGTGNSIVEQSYSFLDKLASEGENFYRLVSVDFAGSEAPSSVLLVERESTSDFAVQIFPNPTRQQLNLVFSQDYGTAVGTIVDLEGRTMISEKYVGTSHTFNTSSLPSGLYILKVQCGFKVEHFKILKH